MRRSLKSHTAFTTIILNINASKNVHTWNKRRTNFPRKFAKSKVVAVPALKQGTLVIMIEMRKITMILMVELELNFNQTVIIS